MDNQERIVQDGVMPQTPAITSEKIAITKPSQSSGPQGTALTPADILRIIRSRLVLISVLFIFFSTISVVAFIAWKKYFPTYSASCLIHCIRNKPIEKDSIVGTQPQKDEHIRFMRDQAMRVVSTGVLLDLVKSPEFQTTQWFKDSEKEDAGKRLDNLKKAVSASPIPETNYIRVQVKAKNKADTAKIVRKLVELYYSKIKNSSLEDFREQYDNYKAEEASLDREISDKIKQIKSRAMDFPAAMVDTEEKPGFTPFQIEIMNAQQRVRELEMNVMELQAIEEAYTNPNQPYTQEDIMMVELNPQVQQLQSQVWALDQEIETQLKRLGHNHRIIKQLKNRKDQVQDQLDQVREQKLDEQVMVKRQQAQTATMSATVALQHATQQKIEAERKQADFNQEYQAYKQLKSDLEFTEEKRLRVRENLVDLQRILDAEAAIEINPRYDTIQEPTSPTLPQTIFLPGFIFMSLGFSIGIAILLELINTTVRSPQDIFRYLHAPILGTIPDADEEEIEIDKVELAVDQNPKSLLAEAFRSVRSSLQFSAPVDQLRRILITSPKPEDGKTSIATNLAYSLAQGGARVLLIDANFRRPHLRGIFSGIGENGLSNILIGSGKLTEFIAKTNINNLDVLGSGPIPPNPAEHLGGKLMLKLLSDETKDYDHVIIDAPPALLVSDSLILSSLVDGVVVVLRAGENTRGMATRALRTLEQANAHLFGVILNAAPMRSGGYFKEQLQTYYDYHEEHHEALPKPASDEDEDEDK